jgi:hypothetical protein
VVALDSGYDLETLADATVDSDLLVPLTRRRPYAVTNPAVHSPAG